MRGALKGEITVFLSLILTCICALMSGLLESARAAGSGWYLQMALDSSVDSLMSQYHRDLWERYRLLLLEFEDSAQLKAELEPYLKAYLDSDSSYCLEPERLEIGSPICVTDGEGSFLEQEILDYMKLGILTDRQDPDTLSGLAEGVKEAAGVGEIMEQYQFHAVRAVKLEETLEDIGASLKNQRSRLEAARRSLQRCDGRGFLSEADRLRRELQKMPGLMERYEEAASELQRELESSGEEAKKRKGDIKEDSWNQLSSAMEQYRTYTDQEGERRKQVIKTGALAEQNLKIVENAIEEAKETQEYIDAWEPDEEDEDDELDEEAMWEPVIKTLSHFQTDQSFEEPGVRDKKKMGLLQSVSRLAQGSLVSLVMPEDVEISEGKADWTGYPSQAEETEGTDSEEGEDPLKVIADTALINEYISRYFTNALSEEGGDLNYEQEYLITGENTDQKNLQGAVKRLLVVREGMNLLHLLSDPEKRGEAGRLAVSILGAASVTPLTAIVTFFILTVWAFAEGVEDLRALLSGKKSPFMKNKENWRLTLEQLLHSAVGHWETGESGEDGGKEKGFTYQDYLKLLFLVQKPEEKAYRMMDLIQLNIAGAQKGFQMNRCAYRIEAECRARGRRITLTRKAEKAY